VSTPPASPKPPSKPRKKASHDAQLLIRINRLDRDRFMDACAQQDTTAAREVRRFIRDFLRQKSHAGGD